MTFQTKWDLDSGAQLTELLVVLELVWYPLVNGDGGKMAATVSIEAVELTVQLGIIVVGATAATEEIGLGPVDALEAHACVALWASMIVCVISW